MLGNIQVTRLRISYIAARIHDRLQVVGGPVAFEQLLANPQPVRGLQISAPFGDGLRVDTEFWSLITETALSTPVPLEAATGLRRAGLPLRYRGSLVATEDAEGVEVPRLEAHLHPFGVVVMATVDLTWSQPVTLGDEVRQRVHELDNTPATMSVDGQETETTLGQAAVLGARSLVQLLTTGGQGTAWDISPHRLVTVISGNIVTPLKAMPTAQSPLHLTLHWLSADDKVLAVPDPASAFVAQWDGSGYGWSTSSLVYMLKSGTSTLSSEAAVPTRAGGEPRTADRHRLLLLQVAYITALSGLVYAAPGSTSSYFAEWAKTAAHHLGRLYGPAGQYAIWGLIPRALMMRTDVSSNIKRILKKEPYANSNYKVSKYP